MNSSLVSLKIILTLLALEGYNVLGIANRAAYYIRNAVDGLCITGGPVMDANKVSLFKTGVLESSNCSGRLNQEWIIKATGNNSSKIKGNLYDKHDNSTQYLLRSFNSKDMNQLLNAKMSGEFVRYFPNPLEFKRIHRSHEDSSQEQYVLYDQTIDSCYESMGQNHVVHISQCNASAPSQRWSLILVNEPVAINPNCSSFWACNAQF